ncbi:MAG: hypothetical protein WA137_05775 [Methanothrix sp.]
MHLEREPGRDNNVFGHGGGSAGWNSTDVAADILKSCIEGRPGWSNLDAVKNNRIYLISNLDEAISFCART